VELWAVAVIVVYPSCIQEVAWVPREFSLQVVHAGLLLFLSFVLNLGSGPNYSCCQAVLFHLLVFTVSRFSLTLCVSVYLLVCINVRFVPLSCCPRLSSDSCCLLAIYLIFKIEYSAGESGLGTRLLKLAMRSSSFGSISEIRYVLQSDHTLNWAISRLIMKAVRMTKGAGVGRGNRRVPEF